MEYLKLFENHSEYDDFVSGGTMVKPNVSHCVQENEVHYNPIPHDYSKDYLTFVALEDGTEIGFTCVSEFGDSGYQIISYSIDGGETWTDTQGNKGGETIAVLSEGDNLLIKGTNVQYGMDVEGGYSEFYADGKVKVEGNPMSLIYGDNFFGALSFPQDSDSNFQYIFAGCRESLVDASNLVLPATTLTDSCYDHMFSQCRQLESGPKILPATTLASYCYQNMFYQCDRLTTAPELPATTLARNCYWGMFASCIKLTTAPELPATTLTNSCYGYMFQGCTKLNYIKAMFTTTPSTNYTYNWVSGVASTGTFVKNSAATWTTTGVNGVPDGWTVETTTE